MKDRLLCIDRGNTRLKAVLFEGERILARFDLGEGLDALGELSPAGVSATLCSVAPSRDAELLAWLEARKIPTWILRGDSETPFPVDVRRRHTLGPDRLAGMAAAWFASRYPALVVDAGTAVTFDLMDGMGRYLGGLIIPGPRLWLDSLASGGEMLPEVALEGELPLPGRETEEALAAGAAFGLAEACEGLAGRLGDLIEGPVSVILTGGAAPLLAKYWRGKAPEIDPDWTMKGLRELHNWSQKEPRP